MNLRQLAVKELFNTQPVEAVYSINTGRVAELCNINYESRGTKMTNWFDEFLGYGVLFYNDMFTKFIDGGYSSYSGFRIKTYGQNDGKLMNEDIDDWKKREFAVYILQKVEGETDIIVCKEEDSQDLTKIISILKIICKDLDINIIFERL